MSLKEGFSGKLDSTSSDDGLSNFISINDDGGAAIYDELQVEPFYPVPVWKWIIPDEDVIKRTLEAVLKIRNDGMESQARSNFNGWQSSDDLHHRDEFKEITNMLLNIGETQVHPSSWECIGMWAGINGKGAGNHVHYHEGVLSGTIWLKSESNQTGGLVFIDPRTRHPLSGPKGKEIFQTNNKGYFPQVGMGVMFPSWLEHFVQANETDTERVSLSFNLV